MPTPITPTTPADHRRLQRRAVRVLATGQVLGGLGIGATVSIGALLLVGISGSPAWSGMAATTGTLGAALLAIPLARLAQARGRRISLTTGALIAVLGAALTITAAALTSLPLVLIGLGLMGAATALNLQSRFAATDLASSDTRARDLSVVVWSTTIGAVAGPNLFEPGEALGRALGLPPLTGGIAIALLAQLLAAVLYLTALRPDPLLVAATVSSPNNPTMDTRGGAVAALRGSATARRAVTSVALSHAVMVALMSMTPVHLSSHGAAITIVGLTISLHIAGMYALSPVFGHLTDRLGARTVVLTGQVLLAAALVTSWAGSTSHLLVTSSLVLLGLGWSAALIAGSAMVTAAVGPTQRPALQGASDLIMNLAGATGGALAGPVLTHIGFDGLSAALTVLVAVVIATNLRRPAAHTHR
ncbi:MFS transporter [Kocuria sp. U4B]